MSGIEFDFSEVNQFAVEIDESIAVVPEYVEKAVGISALKGKQAWREAATGHRYLPRYPFSIDFDKVTNDRGVIGTEVGPNPDLDTRQGTLGIVEDAPGGVNAAPQRNYVAAEKVIEKDLVIGVLKAVDDSLGGV